MYVKWIMFAFINSYQGIWATFWGTMRRYPNFLDINLLSIKFPIPESEGFNLVI